MTTNKHSMKITQPAIECTYDYSKRRSPLQGREQRFIR